MRLGETIATYDVGLALRGKSGKFKITSPAGEIYEVTCKPNHSASNLEWSNSGTEEPPFLVRKVAEGAQPGETTATAIGMLEKERASASSALPFVLEQGSEEGRSLSGRSIELLYLEDDPEVGRASACVYLKSAERDDPAGAERVMTSRCATFNELDSEIRKLEAQLDEIRSRAKKMFYKSHEVALSA